MSPQFLKKLKFLLVLGLLLSFKTGNAQNYDAIKLRIDSLMKIGLPKSALKEVDKLDALARENKNAPQQIRAVIYRMSFQSYLEENALVTIINQLKLDIEQADYPVKPVLQSLLASIYHNYYLQNRWQLSQRSVLEKPGSDITRWDLKTINHEMVQMFSLSLKDYKKEQQTPISVLDGVLAGDRSTRDLRPTLYDLLLNRALEFLLDGEASLTSPKLAFQLNDPRLFGDSRAFAQLVIKTTDTASSVYRSIKYLQQATIFHLQKPDEEALADIDIQRLEFLNRHTSVIDRGNLYFEALAQIAKKFSTKPVSADALVLQGRYYQQLDSLKQAAAYFNKALSAFPDSYGGKNAAGYLKLLQHQDLTAMVENVCIPGKALLGLINYSNLKSVRVFVYKISTTQYDQLSKIPSPTNHYGNNNEIRASDSVFSYLKKLKPVQENTLQLPDLQDYRRHSTEFKIEPLKDGIYLLVIRNALSDNPVLTQLTSFNVSKLSYLTRRNKNNQLTVRVMDRETGAPLPGIQATVEGDKKTTDAKGFCLFDVSNVVPISIKLTTQHDTLYEGPKNSFSRGTLQRPYNRTILFTDREIYRPGQTVYYKGLYLQTQNDSSSLLVNQKLTVTIKNNQKTISSADVTTNEFGTFSGSFTIPQSILNGYVMLGTENGVKPIRVEEYKRPSFTVDFSPVKNSYKPDDSVTVSGMATAYSGYGLSGARVAYHVTRIIQLKNYRDYVRYESMISQSVEVVSGTIKTNDQGKFEIKFKATKDNNINLKDANYRYNINADITDGSGETRSANSSLTVGLNNSTVNAVVKPNIFVRDSIMASISNLNYVKQSGVVQLKIYSLKAPDHLFKSRLWTKPDQFFLSKAEFEKDYPDYAYSNEDGWATWPVENQVAAITSNTDGKLPATFKLDVLSKQPSGMYRLVIQAKNEQGDTTSVTYYTHLTNEPAKTQTFNNWIVPVVTDVKNNSPAEFLIGVDKQCHVLMEKYTNNELRSSQWLTIPGGKQQLVKVPINAAEENIDIQFSMIYQNRVYNSHQGISNNPANKTLDIKFLTLRNKLQPGEKEEWKLQISTKNNEHQAAEMVADLYDASLDALVPPTRWGGLLNTHNRYNEYNNWDYGSVTERATYPLKYNNNYFFNAAPKQYEMLNLFGYNYYGGTSLAVRIRGSNSSEIRIDEPVGNSDVNQIFSSYSSELHEVVVDKGSQVRIGYGTPAIGNLVNIAKVDDYGDQASLSGSPITTRKNFNETAFFYPQLHTNEKGEILIDFTVPEALTKWRFRGLAHTKDLKSGYIETDIVTQKQLSINANMPRFLREGDSVTVSARLANLTALALKGKVKLQFLNALTMQPVSIFINPADAEQYFNVAALTNKPVSFKIFIPAGLDALTYRLTADAGQFTDGEENTLPVLSNRILVTESMPMMVRPGQTHLFTFDKLVNKNSATLKSKTLTLEYTSKPAWYAVQALPYLMEFPYECSEQIFSRYYANSLAGDLVNKLPVIKQVFDQWKATNSEELLSNLEKNQELKATLIEETPWLSDAVNESEQKKRIALLFDLNKMNYEQQLNLNKLQKNQLPDGGFPWFGGDRSDPYITRHILAGFGQLYHLGIVDLKNQELKTMADKAMNYLDNVLAADADWAKKQNKYDNRVLSPTEIHAYYAQSYYTSRTLSPDMQVLLSGYLELAQKQWKDRSIYEQGMIALTMQRNKKPEIARQIIRSLVETAQHTDDLGMYWTKNQLGYYWYQSPVETQSLMIELFTEAGDNDKAVDEMKIWLLRNKQTNNWKTTKATAAACYALLMKGNDWLADNGTTEIKLGGKNLTDLKPGIKADAGTGYIKTNWTDGQITADLGKPAIKNTGKTISWGSMYWQYLEQTDKITPSQTDIHLERKYFIQKQTDSGPVLIAVDANHQPKTGDLLKVVIYLKAGRDFEYVQLKDLRPAGTEPVSVLSAYKYQDGLYYYQVTKDVATNFFISNLNKGNYVFEYQLRVAQPGNFSTGITTIQCMYAPEFNAHSEGKRLTFKP